MNLFEKADLLEQTELELSDFIGAKHKAGLSYLDILAILKTKVTDTQIQAEADSYLHSHKPQNQNLGG